jgi:hypothetical protein
MSIRKLHGVEVSEKIYLIFLVEVTQEGDFLTAEKRFIYSLLLLENGISFEIRQSKRGWSDEDADISGFVRFADIASIEYGENTIFIHTADSTETEVITFKHQNDRTNIIVLNAKDSSAFCNLLLEIVNDYVDYEQVALNNIKTEFDNGNWDIVLALCDEFEEAYGEGAMVESIISFKSRSLLMKGEHRKAIDEIDNVLTTYFANAESIEQNKGWYAELNWYKGYVLSQLNDFNAIPYLQISLSHQETKKQTKEIKELIQSSYNNYKNSFISQEFKNRNIILVDNAFLPIPSNSFSVLLKTQMPELLFPIGHPVEKNMYVCHPYKNTFYLPINSYEAILFRDRVDEFCYVLSCLGATKIEIEFKQGKNIETLTSETKDIDRGMEVKGLGVGLSNQNVNDSESKEQTRTSTKIVKTFPEPSENPYLPENLVWYPYELSWQSLYNERTKRGLLEHKETISSKEIKEIYQSKLQQLSGELQSLVTNANFSNLVSVQETINKSEYTVWDISVTFSNLNVSSIKKNEVQTSSNQQIESSQSENSENEQKYIKEIRFALEDDGKIDDDERKILERKRQKFGISAERGKELEFAILKEKFTADEVEYIEEIRTIFEEDGEISETDRKILERRRMKLNISVERAKELELIVVGDNSHRFTAQELSYIEELKFCLKDSSEITPSLRRFLNKERIKLGLTEERVNEIEKEYIKNDKQ